MMGDVQSIKSSPINRDDVRGVWRVREESVEMESQQGRGKVGGWVGQDGEVCW
jgi:hypothetical protein